MAFCLPPSIADRFISAIGDGTLDPNKLTDLSSADRRAELAKYVGDENAQDVNAALESKMLLKDQQAGFVTWAKQTAGITEPVRRDLISRIEKLDRVLNPTEEKAFLADLAAQKIGATVTVDEAKTLSEGAGKVQELKAAIPESSPIGSKERLAYGLAAVDYHEYFNHLLGKDKENIGDLIKQKKFGKIAIGLAGASKGLQSSMDVSFLLRQGLKTLFTHPTVWAKGAVKMWGDIGKELKGEDAMRLIRADAISRPNAISGEYKAGGYDIGVDHEEALPSTLPEAIPGFRRLYKASEAAYNGMALRLRMDLADQTIAAAKKQGIDTLNPAQAEPLGQLVNALTGRGKVGGFTPGGQAAINATFYSIKFLKSNWDTLTGHSFGLGIKDPAARLFVQKEAAKNLAKIVMVEAAILGTAKALNPNSTELDPRSSLFGKIKVGQTTFDVTASMGAMVTLVSRLIPTVHDGEVGLWNESQTGKWTNLIAGKFGQQNGMDVFANFFEGRLAPVAGLIRDLWKGETFQGQKPTVANEAINLVTPMNWQTMQQSASEPNAAAAVGASIADFLGINANPPNNLGIGLAARDPAELELIRLGFQPNDFQSHTGSGHIDSMIDDYAGPIIEKNVKGFIGSKGYQNMTDNMKALQLKHLIQGSMRMAKFKAAQEDPKAFMRLRAQAMDQRKAAVFEDITGQSPEDATEGANQ